MLVLIDPTLPWLLVYEIHLLQNRIVLIAYYYQILLLNIGF